MYKIRRKLCILIRMIRKDHFSYKPFDPNISPLRDRQFDYLSWRMERAMVNHDLDQYMKYSRRYTLLIRRPNR